MTKIQLHNPFRILPHALPFVLMLMWMVVSGVLPAYAIKDGATAVSPLSEYDSEKLMNEAIRYFHYSSAPDSALTCLEVLSERSKKSNLTADEADIIGRGLNLMGSILVYQNHDHASAAVSFLKAYELGEKFGNRHRMAEANVSLANLNYEEGMLNLRQGFLDESLQRYKEACAQALENKDYELAGIAVINLATVATEAGKLNETAHIIATTSKLEALPEWQRLLCEGTVQWHEGAKEKGISMLDAAADRISVTNKTAADNYRLNILYQKVVMLFDDGRNAEATRFAEEGIRKATEIESEMSLFLFNKLLWEKALEEGRPAEADAYELAAFRARQRLRPLAFDNAIAEGRNNYEKETLHDEIVKSASRMNVLRKTLAIIIALGVVLAGSLIALAIKFRQLRKAKENIVSRDKELLLENAVTAPDAPGPDAVMTEEENQLYLRIERILDNNEEIYDEEFSAVRLAELLNERQATVSALIQKKTGAGFASLLAEKRIKEACRRILDTEKYANMTVEGIAYDVGYKSRSHFSRIFKKTTGMSPTDYMKEARLKK